MRYGYALGALTLLCLSGCSPRQPDAAPLGSGEAIPAAEQSRGLIVDREPLPGTSVHVYHRPDCRDLPPAERRAEVEPGVIEQFPDLHRPCPVCKPTIPDEPQQREEP